jgi:cbb3-type cytochrome oxidase subunit 3
MSLSDVMSAFALQVFPEVGFVLFGTAFLVIAVTMFLRRNRTYFERARFLPLDEDGGAGQGGEVTGHE